MIRVKYREWGDWDEASATHLSLPLVSSFLVFFSILGNSVKGDKRKAKWQIGEEKLERNWEAPADRVLQRRFQTALWILASDRAEKTLCVILPNRWAAGPSSVLCVLIRRHPCMMPVLLLLLLFFFYKKKRPRGLNADAFFLSLQ